MTIEEAIKYITAEKTALVQIEGCDTLFDDAYDVALEAMRKQVPMEPARNNGRNMAWGDDAMVCPGCGMHIWVGQQYCTKCGQKLADSLDDDMRGEAK